MANEKLEAFLDELSELSRKHRIAIGGCGCCGSPWITPDGVRYHGGVPIAVVLEWKDDDKEYVATPVLSTETEEEPF